MLVEYALFSYYLDGSAEVLAGILGGGAKFLFNAQDLVVLGQTLRAARRTGLDLTGRQANYEVSNKGVFSLSRPDKMRTV